MAWSGTPRETGVGPWACQRQRQSRPDRISEALYGSHAEEASIVQEAFMASTTQQVKVVHTRQSHHLSPKVWYILAKSLGIKLHPADRPIFGTVLYILTLLFAAAFSVSHTWYIIYDIINIYTRQTVLTGLVTIAMVLYWCALGVYANQLASKLFNSPKFVDSMRMHTRTVFKVSAAGILVVVGATMTLITSITASQTFSSNYCHNVSVSVVVCKVMFVSRVGYSVFSLVWNLLVGTVLLSVCRTHTIGIRRLISEFEADGKLHEYLRRERHQTGSRAAGNTRESADVDEDLLWDDEATALIPDFPAAHIPGGGGRERLSTGGSVFGASLAGSSPAPLDDATQAFTIHAPNTSTSPGASRQSDTAGVSASSSSRHRDRPTVTSEGVGATSGGDRAGGTETLVEVGGARRLVPLAADREHHCETEQGPKQTSNRPRRDTDSLRNRCEDSVSLTSASSSASLSPPPHILTTFSIDDILIRYWKISTRLRSTSMALQRWLVAWVFYILLWSGTFIVYWVSHDASLMDISQFILPILILPLVCSAYAEVNNEGIRMVKCICPTEERMSLLYFLLQQPLQLTAFGFAINYSTIVTALGALGLAFCSRIILDEMKM